MRCYIWRFHLRNNLKLSHKKKNSCEYINIVFKNYGIFLTAFFQGVTNNSVFEYYSNSWTEQQYLYSVFGFSQQYLVFGIRGFLHPKQYSGIQIVRQNTCPNSFTNLQNKMSCIGQISLFQFHFFPKCSILFGIQYSVFEQLDQIVLFVFSIWIFLIPNRYSVFEFSKHRIVFNIRYSVISKSQIIFGISIRSKKGICQALRFSYFQVLKQEM